MKREGAYLVIGKWNGAPVRVHVLAPLLGVFFSFRSWSLGVAAGLLLIVLAHELGHAILVRRVGGVVRRIDVLPWGGECVHAGVAPGLHESVVAWGGVLAQGVLLAVAELQMLTGAEPPTDFARDLLWTLDVANPLLAAFNLLPIAPLDGAKAWRLLLLGPQWLFSRKAPGGKAAWTPRWLRSWRARRAARRLAALQLEIASRQDPKGPPN